MACRRDHTPLCIDDIASIPKEFIQIVNHACSESIDPNAIVGPASERCCCFGGLVFCAGEFYVYETVAAVGSGFVVDRVVGSGVGAEECQMDSSVVAGVDGGATDIARQGDGSCRFEGGLCEGDALF